MVKVALLLCHITAYSKKFLLFYIHLYTKMKEVANNQQDNSKFIYTFIYTLYTLYVH